MEFIYESEFWVAVSFFIFIGVLVYFGIHKKVASALDARALRISKELEEARRLREEAEKLFADYRRNWAMSSERWTTSSRSPPSKQRLLLRRHASR
jgi:F-type H+-transporting ATPase subunit b